MVFSLLASVSELSASGRYRIQSASELDYDWLVWDFYFWAF